jgi:hypothetical protein
MRWSLPDSKVVGLLSSQRGAMRVPPAGELPCRNAWLFVGTAMRQSQHSSLARSVVRRGGKLTCRRRSRRVRGRALSGLDRGRRPFAWLHALSSAEGWISRHVVVGSAVSCGVVGLVVESRRRVQTVVVRTALLAMMASTTTILPYLNEDDAGAAAERECCERKAAATTAWLSAARVLRLAGVLASSKSGCLTFC